MHGEGYLELRCWRAMSAARCVGWTGELLHRGDGGSMANRKILDTLAVES
jgi:hypothetical protein